MDGVTYLQNLTLKRKDWTSHATIIELDSPTLNGNWSNTVHCSAMKISKLMFEELQILNIQRRNDHSGRVNLDRRPVHNSWSLSFCQVSIKPISIGIKNFWHSKKSNPVINLIQSARLEACWLFVFCFKLWLVPDSNTKEKCRIPLPYPLNYNNIVINVWANG